jgi:hypothetical protein
MLIQNCEEVDPYRCLVSSSLTFAGLRAVAILAALHSNLLKVEPSWKLEDMHRALKGSVRGARIAVYRVERV